MRILGGSRQYLSYRLVFSLAAQSVEAGGGKREEQGARARAAENTVYTHSFIFTPRIWHLGVLINDVDHGG